MKKWINNPVLKGFHPDPSICRAGDDYYIATSTFQWFPGVEIWHSKDLIHWEFVNRPLNEQRLLDMNGIPDSGGVWAPCLTYNRGRFYLVYSNIYTYRNFYKDVDNFLTTADNIHGPWTDPVYLNSSGFDPSMFHDSNGKRYILNQIWDQRDRKNSFYGIYLQEYNEERQCLEGKPVNIFKGSCLGVTEAPHLYKIGRWYYLFCAEGGTFYDHAVTVARAESVTGPYQVSPYHPLLTAKNHPELELQKSGHGCLVETQMGEWYMAYLCSRPDKKKRRCMFGRETAIQKLRMTEDGWFQTEDGTGLPTEQVQAPELPNFYVGDLPTKRSFPGKLPEEFQMLRVPLGKESMQFNKNRESLILYGKESLESLHKQSLVGRRREHWKFMAETRLRFEPDTFQHMAGMALYYDTTNYFYACVSRDELRGKCVFLIECRHGNIRIVGEITPLTEGKMVTLKMEVDGENADFFWSEDGEQFFRMGQTLDATQLSDDFYQEDVHGLRFTGTFIALCCQDLQSHQKDAEYDYFIYQPLEDVKERRIC